MTSAMPRAAHHRQLQRLFTQGTGNGLTDTQLLDRFVANRDDQAFETLVIRHGPMVLAVGRSVLRNHDDAEDAFQATFLILARRAGSIRGRAGLGPWLHRVATRVAIQANVRARRQRQQERRAREKQPTVLPSHEAQADLRRTIHEELERLPEHWRRPVILCDLEGKTHAQAAAELRWGEATVRRRLAAARNRLRSRLSRQGIAPPLAVVPLAIDPIVAGTVVPEAWVAAATKAATGVATGPAGWLAATVLNRMALATLRTTATAGLTFAVLAWAGMAVRATGPESDPVASPTQDTKPKANGGHASPPPAQAARDQIQNPESETVEIQGRVLDPDGRPRAGAKLYLGLTSQPGAAPPQPVRATSGPDGRYRFEVSRGDLAKLGAAGSDIVLAALAKGSGPAWIRLEPTPTRHECTLTLKRDDVPVTGRVLDLDGRPVAGATVTATGVIAVPDDDVSGWLRTLEANQGRSNPNLWKRMSDRLYLGGSGLLSITQTQSNGGFRLEGLGRDRIVVITVTGPAIATVMKTALTTDDPGHHGVLLPNGGSKPDLLYGSNLNIVASPARSVEGIVRDFDTDEPLQGIMIQEQDFNHVNVISDAQGRYRITGIRDNQGVTLKASSFDKPYMITDDYVNFGSRSGTATANFAMKRGTWIEGRVTDRATGKAVMATVDYIPFHDNPGRTGKTLNTDLSASTDALGRYRIVGHPGRGILAVRAKDPGYLSAPPLTAEIERETRLAFYFQLHSHERVDVIDLPPGSEPFSHDFQLDPTHSQLIMINGPDGAPMAGTIVDGLDKVVPTNFPVKEASFRYFHPSPGTVETLIFHQKSKQLGAALEVTGTEPRPLRVTLAPTASVAGRLVDADGRPRPHVALVTFSRRRSRKAWIAEELWNSRTTTDAEGRFQVDGLVPGPGVEYEIRALGEKPVVSTARPVLSHWWTAAPGESNDWGDVQELPPTDDRVAPDRGLR